MNEKPNTECILTTLQNTRNNYVRYYPKNVKLPLAVDHITHNKEMKCKLNTSQCVLTIIIVGPRMRKVGGGGEGADDEVPNLPPLDPTLQSYSDSIASLYD